MYKVSFFSKVRYKLFQFLGLAFSKVMSFKLISKTIDMKLKVNKKFYFKKSELNYFYHSYNNYGWTERVIEIPIVKWYLKNEKPQNVLEIGNVTNHYYDEFKTLFTKKTVVDKFEIAYDVVNCDIAEYKVEKKFDFIFSVSTFEHMDSDLGRNPDYIDNSKYGTHALDNIKKVYDNLLSNDGKFVITAPLLYAHEWDKTFYMDFDILENSDIKRYLFKYNGEFDWTEVDVDTCKNMKAVPYSEHRFYLAVIEIKKIL